MAKTNKLNHSLTLRPFGLTLPTVSIYKLKRIFDKYLNNFVSVISTLDRQATVRKQVEVTACIFAFVMGLYGLLFLMPKKVNFAYQPLNCFFNPTFLPSAVKATESDQFDLKLDPKFSIAGHPIYSETTCVVPTAAPESGSKQNLSLNPAGSSFLRKNILISVGSLPAAQPAVDLEKPLSLRDPLKFDLDQPDLLFKYRLQANHQGTACTVEQTSIKCDLAELNLAQGSSYDFVLERFYEDKSHGTVLNQTVKIVDPVSITSASVAQGSTVHSAPQAIDLTFNKPISRYGGVVLEQVTDGSRETIPTTVGQRDNLMSVNFGKALPRETSFELTINDVESDDGAYLPSKYVLSFATSSGPKVIAINIGQIKVSPDSNFVITFDAALKADQDFAKFAQIEAGGNRLAASVTSRGNQITINPADSLGRCTPFSIVINSGLVNEYGVGEGKAWRYNSKTICQTVFSIGSSVRGRSLTAYRFGTGPSVIIFVGGMHGNEKSSVYIMNRWVDYLESHAENIPANRTLIVIPNLNPDGYSKGSRYNANGVDLNRNFDSNSWTSGNNGGSEPMSEPESQALANYVRSTSPRLVLTYHAAGGVVMANEAGDSESLATLYAQNSNVNKLSGGGGGDQEFFGYQATGTFEGWLKDRQGKPALLIELWTKSGQEFGGNQNALWAMVGI